MKGMRVQSIIRELRGEKIDIIEYHEDAVTFAEKALQPAKVSRVTVVDISDKHLEVIVDDSQLSLAIGKKGQNVRLAAKLLGWKIDIKSEEEKRQEVEQQMQALVNQPATPLESVPDLGEGVIEKLAAAGVTSVESLADMTPEQLEAIDGIGPKTVEKISIAVNNYFSSLESGENPPEVYAAEDQPATEAGSGEGITDVNSDAAPLDAGPDQLEGAPTGDPVADDITGVEQTPHSDTAELLETEQTLEGITQAAVEDAPPADEEEVHTHGEHPGEADLDPEKL
jgi:N utilization substance protein A